MPEAIPPRVRRGFTIIELLVVIGIIAILIGILLPALMQARRQAKDLACESNIRQISQALLIYATENQGLFPAGSGFSWRHLARTHLAASISQPLYRCGCRWRRNLQLFDEYHF